MSKSSFASKFLTTKVLGTVALSGAFLASGALVMSGSTAAFSGTTANNSTWDAGVVNLTNDHASALFTGKDIVPGYAEKHCMTVNSLASGTTKLKMYADTVADVASIMDSKLVVTILEGQNGVNTDGSVGDCTGFVSSATKFSGTLGEFKAHNSFATGLSESVLPAGGSKQYQISVSLPETVGNEAQGAKSSVKFSWESRS